MLALSKQDIYRERYKRIRPGWRPSGEEFEALTRSHFGPRSRVLDLGCGRGPRDADASRGRGGVMERFWREVKLAVGLDPDLASLAHHRTREPPEPGLAGAKVKDSLQQKAHMPLVCGFGEALPFPPACFDLVIGLWLLEHLRRPQVALTEIRRVLVRGGHFIFVTPNARHPLIMANRFGWAFPAVQRLLVPRLYGRAEADTFRVYYRANTAGRLRELAGACGFRVAALRTHSDPTYVAFNDLLFWANGLLEDLLPAEWGVHLMGDLARD